MKKQRVVALIECRMTSSRLPGKVMLKSCGKTMLEHIVERLGRVKRIDEIVFATTDNSTDDCIEKLADTIGIGCYRGSEADVLGRVLLAAKRYQADVIVEVTGDCPLIDSELTAQTLDFYFKNDCDYASNDNPQTYPLGTNIEVFSTEMLEIANREGVTEPDREHVSWYFVRNPDRFKCISLHAKDKLHWPDLRLTLDEKEDFILINNLFEHFYSESAEFSLEMIVAYLKNHPEFVKINCGIVQKCPDGS